MKRRPNSMKMLAIYQINVDDDCYIPIAKKSIEIEMKRK